MSNRAAIILCGGKSSRMGFSKPLLPFGDELMLQRVARILKPLVKTRVVVAARHQLLPELDADIKIAYDAQESRGPLEGLLAGFQVLPNATAQAFVTSCDVPLLKAELVEHLFQLCDETEADVVVPKEERFYHPLAAVYRPSVQAAIEQLLAVDQLRPRKLFELAETHEVDVETLVSFDPNLDSFRNLNDPDDYKQCLKDTGLPLDPNLNFDIN